MAPCKPAERRVVPSGSRIKNAGRWQQAKNRAGWTAPPQIGSALLLLDIVDDLGHVVLVLAEFGSVFDQFLFFLFGLLERHRPFLLFLVLDGLDLLGLQIGIDLLGADRLQLLLDR